MEDWAEERDIVDSSRRKPLRVGKGAPSVRETHPAAERPRSAGEVWGQARLTTGLQSPPRMSRAKARALRSLGKYSVKPLYCTFQPLLGVERFMQAVM